MVQEERNLHVSKKMFSTNDAETAGQAYREGNALQPLLPTVCVCSLEIDYSTKWNAQRITPLK